MLAADLWPSLQLPDLWKALWVRRQSGNWSSVRLHVVSLAGGTGSFSGRDGGGTNHGPIDDRCTARPESANRHSGRFGAGRRENARPRSKRAVSDARGGRDGTRAFAEELSDLATIAWIVQDVNAAPPVTLPEDPALQIAQSSSIDTGLADFLKQLATVAAQDEEPARSIRSTRPAKEMWRPQ